MKQLIQQKNVYSIGKSTIICLRGDHGIRLTLVQSIAEFAATICFDVNAKPLRGMRAGRNGGMLLSNVQPSEDHTTTGVRDNPLT
jgi:hypothetical protein